MPKILLNTARIPLGAFAGVDLRRITSVRFDFSESLPGAVLLTDIAFAR